MKFKSIRAKDEQHQVSRRALIGWMSAAGAALSVPLWKTWEVIEKTHGSAWAQGASCVGANRLVDICMGGGALAWATQVFPYFEMARDSTQATQSYLYQANRGAPAVGTDRDLWIGPATQRIYDAIPNYGKFGHTIFLSGQNETHNSLGMSPITSSRGNTSNAVSEVMHTTNSFPRLLSGIGVGNAFYGTAPGAAPPTTVGSAGGMVDLFDSAATQAGGVLASTQNADLFKRNVDALMSLNRLAGRASTQSAFQIGRDGAFVIGKNFREILEPSFADRDRYGLNGGMFGDVALDGGMQDLGNFLIITSKLFENGLTPQSLIQGRFAPGDPHGGFGGGTLAASRNYGMALGYMMGAFFEDMQKDDPYCSGEPMHNNSVFTLHGDTPKSGNNNNGGNWADGTSGGHNFSVAFGGGWLKTGQFGNLSANNQYTGWSPQTGELDGNMQSNQLGATSAGAIIYALSKGKMRDAEVYGRVDTGPIVENLTG